MVFDKLNIFQALKTMFSFSFRFHLLKVLQTKQKQVTVTFLLHKFCHILDIHLCAKTCGMTTFNPGQLTSFAIHMYSVHMHNKPCRSSRNPDELWD